MAGPGNTDLSWTNSDPVALGVDGRGTQRFTDVKETNMRYLLALFILLCAVPAFAVPAFAATATLTWIDNSTNEKNFNIERKNEVCAANVLPWAEISVVTENVVTYKDIALPEGASYCYRVAASNPAGKSLWSNTAGLTVPFTIPAAPSLLGATSGP